MVTLGPKGGAHSYAQHSTWTFDVVMSIMVLRTTADFTEAAADRWAHLTSPVGDVLTGVRGILQSVGVMGCRPMKFSASDALAVHPCELRGDVHCSTKVPLMRRTESWL